MKITLKNHSFLSTGNFKGYTKASLKTRLREAGATLKKKAPDAQDVMLVGTRPGKIMREEVYFKGGLVLNEGESLALLEHGELDWPMLEEGTDFGELVPKLRSLLAGPTTAQTWAHIAQLIDTCRPSHHDHLLAYLKPQLDRWPDRSDHQWSAPAAGATRPAPWHWFAQEIGGRAHPFFCLCNAVSFDGLESNLWLTKPLVDHAPFEQILSLDLRSEFRSSLPPRFLLEQIFVKDLFPKLRWLGLGAIDWHDLHDLRPSAQIVGRLEWLDMVGNHLAQGQTMSSTPRGPFTRLTSCALQRTMLAQDNRPLFASLPHLDHLHLADPRPHYAASTTFDLTHVAPWDQITRVSLALADFDSAIALLKSLATDTKAKLDQLVLVEMREEALVGEEGKLAAERMFLDHSLCARITQVVVHTNVSPEVCRHIQSFGIDVLTPYHTARALEPIPKVPSKPDDPPHLRTLCGIDYFTAQGWDVVLSLLDQMDHEDTQLTPDQRRRLLLHLERWDDRLRLWPNHWFGHLTGARPRPFALAARALCLNTRLFPRNTRPLTQALSALQAGPDIALAHLELHGLPYTKTTNAALASLVRDWGIAKVHILERPSKESQAAAAHLESHAPVQTAHDPEALRGRDLVPSYRSAMAPGAAHIWLRIADASALGDLLATAHCDLIRTLDLEIDLPSFLEKDEFPSPSQVQRPTWNTLEFLRISYTPSAHDELHDLLAMWLSHARPHALRTGDSASWMRGSKLAQALAQKGCYARAVASHLDLSDISAPQALAVLRRTEVQAGALTLSREIIPLERALRSLGHPLQHRLYSCTVSLEAGGCTAHDLDAFITALPRLEHLGVRWQGSTESFLELVAATPASARLFSLKFTPNLDFADLTAKERKILDAGIGAPSFKVKKTHNLSL